MMRRSVLLLCLFHQLQCSLLWDTVDEVRGNNKYNVLLADDVVKLLESLNPIDRNAISSVLEKYAELDNEQELLLDLESTNANTFAKVLDVYQSVMTNVSDLRDGDAEFALQVIADLRTMYAVTQSGNPPYSYTVKKWVHSMAQLYRTLNQSEQISLEEHFPYLKFLFRDDENRVLIGDLLEKVLGDGDCSPVFLFIERIEAVYYPAFRSVVVQYKSLKSVDNFMNALKVISPETYEDIVELKTEVQRRVNRLTPNGKRFAEKIVNNVIRHIENALNGKFPTVDVAKEFSSFASEILNLNGDDLNAFAKEFPILHQIYQVVHDDEVLDALINLDNDDFEAVKAAYAKLWESGNVEETLEFLSNKSESAKVLIEKSRKEIEWRSQKLRPKATTFADSVRNAIVNDIKLVANGGKLTEEHILKEISFYVSLFHSDLSYSDKESFLEAIPEIYLILDFQEVRCLLLFISQRPVVNPPGDESCAVVKDVIGFFSLSDFIAMRNVFANSKNLEDVEEFMEALLYENPSTAVKFDYFYSILLEKKENLKGKPLAIYDKTADVVVTIFKSVAENEFSKYDEIAKEIRFVIEQFGSLTAAEFAEISNEFPFVAQIYRALSESELLEKLSDFTGDDLIALKNVLSRKRYNNVDEFLGDIKKESLKTHAKVDLLVSFIRQRANQLTPGAVAFAGKMYGLVSSLVFSQMEGTLSLQKVTESVLSFIDTVRSLSPEDVLSYGNMFPELGDLLKAGENPLRCLLEVVESIVDPLIGEMCENIKSLIEYITISDLIAVKNVVVNGQKYNSTEQILKALYDESPTTAVKAQEIYAFIEEKIDSLDGIPAEVFNKTTDFVRNLLQDALNKNINSFEDVAIYLTSILKAYGAMSFDEKMDFTREVPYVADLYQMILNSELFKSVSGLVDEDLRALKAALGKKIYKNVEEFLNQLKLENKSTEEKIRKIVDFIKERASHLTPPAREFSIEVFNGVYLMIVDGFRGTLTSVQFANNVVRYFESFVDLSKDDRFSFTKMFPELEIIYNSKLARCLVDIFDSIINRVDSESCEDVETVLGYFTIDDALALLNLLGDVKQFKSFEEFFKAVQKENAETAEKLKDLWEYVQSGVDGLDGTSKEIYETNVDIVKMVVQAIIDNDLTSIEKIKAKIEFVVGEMDGLTLEQKIDFAKELPLTADIYEKVVKTQFFKDFLNLVGDDFIALKNVLAKKIYMNSDEFLAALKVENKGTEEKVRKIVDFFKERSSKLTPSAAAFAQKVYEVASLHLAAFIKNDLRYGQLQSDVTQLVSEFFFDLALEDKISYVKMFPELTILYDNRYVRCLLSLIRMPKFCPLVTKALGFIDKQDVVAIKTLLGRSYTSIESLITDLRLSFPGTYEKVAKIKKTLDKIIDQFDGKPRSFLEEILKYSEEIVVVLLKGELPSMEDVGEFIVTTWNDIQELSPEEATVLLYELQLPYAQQIYDILTQSELFVKVKDLLLDHYDVVFEQLKGRSYEELMKTLEKDFPGAYKAVVAVEDLVKERHDRLTSNAKKYADEVTSSVRVLYAKFNNGTLIVKDISDAVVKAVESFIALDNADKYSFVEVWPELRFFYDSDDIRCIVDAFIQKMREIVDTQPEKDPEDFGEHLEESDEKPMCGCAMPSKLAHCPPGMSCGSERSDFRRIQVDGECRIQCRHHDKGEFVFWKADTKFAHFDYLTCDSGTLNWQSRSKKTAVGDRDVGCVRSQDEQDEASVEGSPCDCQFPPYTAGACPEGMECAPLNATNYISKVNSDGVCTLRCPNSAKGQYIYNGDYERFIYFDHLKCFASGRLGIMQSDTVERLFESGMSTVCIL